ncbi:DinB family protein [Paenibacillus sp. FSL R10-2734]|uniref:DinB family protein n=1 Tax=Paenibacillus sp. FSL R10-2734 TaxID=2954691 RepID=UPI0030DDC51E
MTITSVLPIWQAVQERFHKMVKALPEEDLNLKLGNSTIGGLISHSAEVEFMFAEWFFGRPKPEGEHAAYTTLNELVDLLAASNENLIAAMRELPEEAWHVNVESKFGTSTPLEAVGRLMYHTGIHAGQISLIQKNAVRSEVL